MNAAIVDTGVVSILFKGDTRPLERSWGHLRKTELEEHLKCYAVLPVSRELCRKWAEIGR